MSQISPTLEGFRAAFRRPSLTLAEISWRWTVGGAATALFLFSLLEYLDTLPVTGSDVLLLRTRQPILISQALGHIFNGSSPRFVMAGLVAVVALTFLWIVAASVGRATTVRSLMDYFAERQTAINGGQELVAPPSLAAASEEGSRPLGSLLRLNFLRASLALAAILAFVGAVILVQMISAGFGSSSAASPGVSTSGAALSSNAGPGIAFLLFFPLVALVFLAWSTLNWVLSLAGIFAVGSDGDSSPGDDAFGALSAAVTFCRERTGPVFAVSIWTGLAHLTVFVVATTALSVPLGLAQIVPWRVVLAAVILVGLAYLAVADWLYMVRLAGYVCIAEMPEALLAPAPQISPQAPPRGGELEPGATPHTTIDRDEPILCDVPSLALET